jgi:GNAT superfamily N-acetyltransferase
VSAVPDDSDLGGFRVDLRQARAGDGRAIAQVLADHDRFDGRLDDPAAAAVRIESLLPDAHDPLRTLLVAEEPLAGVVGYVHWQVTYPVFLDGPSLYLTELFVGATYRGRGVGSLLLDAVHAEADALGSARVELVQVRGTEAHRRGFYRDRGYRHADHLDVLRRRP